MPKKTENGMCHGKHKDKAYSKKTTSAKKQFNAAER